MPALCLRDLDPQIARKVQRKDRDLAERSAGLQGFPGTPRILASSLMDAELQQVEAWRKLPPSLDWRHYSPLLLSLLLLLPSGFLMATDKMVGGLCWAGASILIVVISALTLPRIEKRHTMGRRLAYLLRLVGEDEGERAYAIAAAELVEVEKALGETVAREWIEALGDLLEGYRRLKTERTRVERVSSQNPEAIQEEARRLERQLAQTGDPAARDAMAQSLALCNERLERAQRWAPLQERIAAQQEAILQGMHALQSGLASLHLPLPSPSATDDLHATIAALRQRARAVEDALQEVAAWSGRDTR